MLNEESKPNDAHTDPRHAGSAPDSENVPNFRLKERTRGPSILKRTVAVLSLEPGIFEEIASDRGATRQSLGVFVIAASLSWGLPDAPSVLLNWMVALVPVTISILLFRLAARLFTADVPPYMHWFRAMLFASAPWALGAVPVVGSVMGALYAWVLAIIVVRDLCRISTGQAVLTWLIAILVPGVAIAFAAILPLFLVINPGQLPKLLGL